MFVHSQEGSINAADACSSPIIQRFIRFQDWNVNKQLELGESNSNSYNIFQETTTLPLCLRNA